MSPERVLANPLSGLEIVEAIVDKMRQRLLKDCHLSPNLAYDFFLADVIFSIQAHDIGRQVDVVAEEVITEASCPEDASLEAADAEFHIDAEAPNVVRVESGQPVPVLTKDSDGQPSIKGVRYSRKQLEKASAR